MKQVTIRLEKPLAEKLKSTSRFMNIPVNDLINIILYSHYQSVEQE